MIEQTPLGTTAKIIASIANLRRLSVATPCESKQD